MSNLGVCSYLDSIMRNNLNFKMDEINTKDINSLNFIQKRDKIQYCNYKI